MLGQLCEAGHELSDSGAHEPSEQDGDPDYVTLLARAVVSSEVNCGDLCAR